jgi:(1->4)-alpha-D-glucan 1-alpha-D-glucosylmutase
MTRPLRIPRATYRLQFNREFTFNQANEIVPYLAALGISHCYASPILKARPGSMHGYDIVDHNSINPEIGSAADLDRLVDTLHKHGMGLVLDIVPNHMGVMGSDNAWWLDVLENGESSMYANFFDIDWQPLKEELQGKVLIPVLHDQYGVVLESGDLKLVFRPDRGEFDITYHEHRFPVDPQEYPRILQHCGTGKIEIVGDLGRDTAEFQSLINGFRNLPGRHEISNERIAERNGDKEIYKRRLAELCARSPETADCLLRAVELINGEPGNAGSFDDLHELIKAQAFRLADWRVASDDINYRRFFDTNDLAGIRMENENVFEATHRLILRLIAEGKVDGLRLDHPDGLYDPAQYFERLRGSIANAQNAGAVNDKTGSSREGSSYVVIEKILTGAERLPPAWFVSGTTGYDFSNIVNGLFVESSAATRMERIYRHFTGESVDYEELAYRCRKLIIRVALVSELNVLANRLARIALSKRRTCDFTLNGLRDALTEVVANFPVYRTYLTTSGVSENDTRYIRLAIASAKWRSPAAETSIFDFLSEVLLTRIIERDDPGYENAVRTFAMKFQQFTSPVMAKGLEDTAFYRYNRLIALNDVGGDLHRFGIAPSEFHFANQERLHSWPATMLATSTHDSKRSEDVRARINVLSEIPGLWRLRVRRWRDFNREHKRTVNDRPAPSSNDEYLLYQTLIGAWPSSSRAVGHEETESTFSERIETFMLKAIREAKKNTSWINRNEEYEAAVSSFVKLLVTPSEENQFLADFLPFQRRVARIGLWNSLSQTLLKLTSPGVPDIYQGNELLDFSLVDPDNRRPVDYVYRRQLFEYVRKIGDAAEASSIAGSASVWRHYPIANLLQTPEDGRLKLYLTWKALGLRQRHPEVFQQGEYFPLTVEGSRANHVVAFCRRSENTSVLVIAPRLVATLLHKTDTPPTGPQVWEDTRVLLPDNNPEKYYNVLTGALVDIRKAESSSCLNMSEIFAILPGALCISN